MSSGCCDVDAVDQMATAGRRKTLYVVLWINILVFVAELGAGIPRRWWRIPPIISVTAWFTL